MHNNTTAYNVFPTDLVNVGRFSYGQIAVYSWNSIGESLSIGDFCSIATGVKFLLGGNHRLDFLSTFPIRYYIDREVEAYSNGPIVLKNDVWIGCDVIILSGVKLEQGCVVAAGSVVTKSFSEYSIIAGVPAKLIGKRFDDIKIKILKDLDFSTLTKDEMVKHKEDFYVNINDISEIVLKQFFKFLKK